jgi:hypothetical protein
MRAVTPVRKTISKLRSALATALIFWCAGAGCMMVSYARDAAMGAAVVDSKSGNAGWGQASGSGGAHDCCKARHASERQAASSKNHVSFSDSPANQEELVEGSNSSDAISCCPLTSGTFVVSGRQNLSNESVLAPRGADAGQTWIGGAAVDVIAMPLRLPNQSETYLRGCVFLI